MGFAANVPPPSFLQLRWIAAGSEYEALASAPIANQAVLKVYDYEGFPDSVDQHAGEVLFNTPALLGGQAAKAGLSCASCHINGRTNPHFFVAGVSGKPGSADVTNSFFSALRGNGRFDPVPIPDLAQPGKVSRDEDKHALEPFIRNLIVEEFGGAEPSPATLQALSAYVRALRMPGPYRQGQFRRRHTDQTHLIREGALAAYAMIDKSDRQGAVLALSTIRHQLELLHERYAGAKLTRERRELLKASVAIGRIADIQDLTAMAKAVAKWHDGFKTTEKMLHRAQEESLYNPKKLAEALGVAAKDYPFE